jgi:zinc protease
MNFLQFWPRHRIVTLLSVFSLCIALLQPVISLAGQSSQKVQDSANAKAKVSSKAVLGSGSLTQNVRRTVLENGLVVLTKEVHTAPVAAVQVWYKIGSRNEAPGVNGIAHQLEHMLFQGTKERPVQFGRLLNTLGSSFNATTRYDQTNYFATVEKDKIGSVLTLEADRMQNAILDPKALEKEKQVVISEVQGAENSPAYQLNKAVQALALPDSPYGLMVGGTKADVQKFTIEQVKSYYDSYYAPNNATVIIVGDFKTEEVLQQVRTAFGKIPRRKLTVKPPVAKPRVVTSRSITVREPGSVPILNAIYPLPNASHPDVPAIDILSFILSTGRNARLNKALVETGLATNVSMGAANFASGGWGRITAVPTGNQPLTKLDQIILQEITKIQQQKISPAELEIAKTQLQAKILLASRDIESQADQLGTGETTAGDYRFTDKYVANIAKVTIADVQRVANQYFKPGQRVVGFFEPDNTKGQPAPSGGSQHNQAANLGPPLDPGELQKYLPVTKSVNQQNTQSIPQVFKLANELQVILLPDSSSPTVTLGGFISAGTEFESVEKAGLASLTAGNVMNGTKTKDALTLARTLENRGASLEFGLGQSDGVPINGSALSKDLPLLLQTLGDVVQNATFPEQEVEKVRMQGLVLLQNLLNDPSTVARKNFMQTVYSKEHPFSKFPTLESLKTITVADLKAFYQQHYQPQNTTLALVGQFEPAQAKRLIEQSLGTWKNQANNPQPNYPKTELPAKVITVNPPIPGKTQSITVMGNPAINRSDPRFYAATVFNEILGGNTLSSRLGNAIRDRLGLTYGITSTFVTGKEQGVFLIGMQTAPENAQRAVSSTLSLLQDIKAQGFSAGEVENAKQSIVSSYAVGLASPDAVAGTTLNNIVQALPASELVDFPQKIKAVTVVQVKQVAQELLHPDRFVIVTAGPPMAGQSSRNETPPNNAAIQNSAR